MQQFRRCCAILAAGSLLIAQMVPLEAQHCSSGTSGARYAGYHCDGGGCGPDYDKIHIRVKVVASDTITAAAWSAVDQWNGQKDVTKMVFDQWDPRYGDPDIVIQDASSEVECSAAYDGVKRIGYNQNMVGIIATDFRYGAAVFAHEIGHFMGLDDELPTATGTIMNQHDGHGEACLDGWRDYPLNTLTVQAADGATGGDCARAQRAGNSLYGLPPTIRNMEVGDGTYCYDTWETTTVWDCSYTFGCVYLYSYDEYLGRTCP